MNKKLCVFAVDLNILCGYVCIKFLVLVKVNYTKYILDALKSFVTLLIKLAKAPPTYGFCYVFFYLKLNTIFFMFTGIQLLGSASNLIVVNPGLVNINLPRLIFV